MKLPSLRVRPRRTIVLASLFVVSLASVATAQRYGFFREGPGNEVRWPPRDFVDGAFTVCKMMYTSVRREPMGIGWWTDYPYAGNNLMIRLSELTKTPVSMDVDGNPNYWVVRLTDDALFKCPFMMASDVGTLAFSPEEGSRLREYLLKGGFLWVDDFWGERAWEQWAGQIEAVLPEYPIVELPFEHPLFHTLFQVSKVPQITNIQNWRRTRDTSERGEETRVPHFRAILDDKGRILVAMTFNTDMGDSWEREGEDHEFFLQFAPDGYALGIDVLLYAMTH